MLYDIELEQNANGVSLLYPNTGHLHHIDPLRHATLHVLLEQYHMLILR